MDFIPGEQTALQGWETELFGGTYDEAKPFERCKYGALSVPWVNAILTIFYHILVYFSLWLWLT